jgi:hypothetical protein
MRAFHRTGRVSGSITCHAPQWAHRSLVCVVRAGTSLRLVVPQRVQFHSAVSAATVMAALSPSPRGELLERPADEL